MNDAQALEYTQDDYSRFWHLRHCSLAESYQTRLYECDVAVGCPCELHQDKLYKDRIEHIAS